MRSFRKTSVHASHDFVVHLTVDEATRLLEEVDDSVTEQTSTLAKLRTSLGKPLAKYEDSL